VKRRGLGVRELIRIILPLLPLIRGGAPRMRDGGVGEIQPACRSPELVEGRRQEGLI